MPRRLLLLLGLLLAWIPGPPACAEVPVAPPPGAVAVLRSPPTLKTGGFRGQWELEGAGEVLRRLGLSFRWVEPADLEAGRWRGRLLILPDVRQMSAGTAAAVRRYVEGGGQVLATYQTSYRDEENRPLQPPGFRLGDLFGVDFHRWAGASPVGTYLVLEPELGGGQVQLGRAEAMLVRARPGSRVLAVQQGPEASPAILQSPAGIYVGASLLAPENSDSAQVALLVGRLLERLLPGWSAPTRVPEGAGAGPRPPVEEDLAGGAEVAVGLAALDSEARLSAPGGLRWAGGSAPEVRVRRIATLGKPPAVALYDRQGRLLLRSEGPVRLESSGFFELVRWNPNGTYRWSAWRGQLLLEPGPEAVALVNLVPLEGYLRGVVPNEMPPWFPPQALRAMAVVARTFTLSGLGRHRAQGYDLCPTVHCQVYEGLATEHPTSGAAVRETRGQVLAWEGGRLVEATYHAACGGVGEAPEAVWPGAAPGSGLAGLPDTTEPLPPSLDLSREEDLVAFLDHPPRAWCQGAGRFRWEETWSLEELGRKVEEALPRLLGPSAPSLGRLRGLQVRQRTPHGRVATLVLLGERAQAEVHGDAVRWLTSGGRIGAGGLQSALFYVEVQEGKVRFRGGGWGHGVGLCQEGAAGRARGGQGYREILEHYYPGARLGAGEGARLEAERGKGRSLER